MNDFTKSYSILLTFTYIFMIAALFIPIKNKNKASILNILSIGVIFLTILLDGPFYDRDIEKIKLSISEFDFELLGFIKFKFSINDFSLLFINFMSFIQFPAINYSYSYMNSLSMRRSNIFTAQIIFCVLVTFWLFFSGNLISMFCFYEMLTISTIFLVNHENTNHSRKSLITYLLLLIIPSLLFFLPSCIFVEYFSNFIAFSSKLSKQINFYNFDTNYQYLIRFILSITFTLGITKTAIFPLGKWLIRAMVAPHPVSALLHSVAIVNAGIYCLLVILDEVLNFNELIISYSYAKLLIILPILTYIIPAILALFQKSLKKLLAYSTISQLGIILISIFSAKPIPAVMYAFFHSLSKIVLFFIAGEFYKLHRITLIEDLKGIRIFYPILFYLFIFISLSIYGAPFFSMYYIKKEIFKEYYIYNVNIFKYLSVIFPSITFLYLSKPIYFMNIKSKLNKQKYNDNVNYFPLLFCAFPIFFGFLYFIHCYFNPKRSFYHDPAKEDFPLYPFDNIYIFILIFFTYYLFKSNSFEKITSYINLKINVINNYYKVIVDILLKPIKKLIFIIYLFKDNVFFQYLELQIISLLILFSLIVFALY